MRARSKKKRSFRDCIKWIIFATNLVVILLLLTSFLSWKVSPLKTNLFSYIGLGFGFILLLNIAYLIFWIFFSKWKLALVSLGAILICHKPVTTFFPTHLFPVKEPHGTIEVLTYNVQGFPEERDKNSAKHPILDYIAATDADIVCLQEYLVSKTGQSIFSQRDVNRILNQYPYQSVTGLESSGKYHIFGLACFSKHPIEQTEEIVFESSYNGAAVYTINIDGKRYTVANVHLESNSIMAEDKKLYSDFIQNNDSVKLEEVASNIRSRLGNAYRMRARQVEKVKRVLATQGTEGTIICGDFNDTPISYAYARMKKGLKDAYVSTAFGPGITYHEDLFLFRIDYILHSEELKAFRTRVDRVTYSDHYPLRTHLKWVNDSNENK
ncbi:MAG: endonuclease/exonuclease/phosphatase family protein [bacterium]|nr:endonuclease/exonuclease/phosphatase family protein [bacterium]MDD3625412.1 endonuclease/exonuclease/phosphatase family protein [Proteiniphilum sp.]MDD3968927.1 endonuclease/exonuclease/phosphatase family protein [Proteiniphilum sp.]MDD4459059.1 endonuclease/exonuclease/phosphatase family protein [Proteiniphilum sp.]